MRVLMAEDLESARERLTEMIGDVQDLEVRFVGQDVMSLLQTAGAWRPDVVILDVRMRGMIVLGVLETLKSIWPGMSVVISAFDMDAYYRAAFLKHGADCAIDKSFEWNGLLTFLQTQREREDAAAVDSAPANTRDFYAKAAL